MATIAARGIGVEPRPGRADALVEDLVRSRSVRALPFSASTLAARSTSGSGEKGQVGDTPGGTSVLARDVRVRIEE